MRIAKLTPLALEQLKKFSKENLLVDLAATDHPEFKNIVATAERWATREANSPNPCRLLTYPILAAFFKEDRYTHIDFELEKDFLFINKSNT